MLTGDAERCCKRLESGRGRVDRKRSVEFVFPLSVSLVHQSTLLFGSPTLFELAIVLLPPHIAGPPLFLRRVKLESRCGASPTSFLLRGVG